MKTLSILIADSYKIGGRRTIKKNSENPYLIILTMSTISVKFKSTPEKIPFSYFLQFLIFLLTINFEIF